MKKNLQIIFYILMIISLLLSLASRMLLMSVEASSVNSGYLPNISIIYDNNDNSLRSNTYTFNVGSSINNSNDSSSSIYIKAPLWLYNEKVSLPKYFDLHLQPFAIPKHSQGLVTFIFLVDKNLSSTQQNNIINNIQCGYKNSPWQKCTYVDSDSTNLLNLLAENSGSSFNYRYVVVNYAIPNDTDNLVYVDLVQLKFNNSLSINSSRPNQIAFLSNYDYQIVSNDSTNQQLVEESKKQTEQLEQQTQTQKEIQDSINDDDTSGANDKAGSFFNDFKSDDPGGLSDIITKPLVLINSLLSNSNSCSDLNFSILGKDVILPSGCLIWSKVPDNVVNIYQTLICGFISYFILRKLFKDVDKLKNPNDSEVSTVDL